MDVVRNIEPGGEASSTFKLVYAALTA